MDSYRGHPHTCFVSVRKNPNNDDPEKISQRGRYTYRPVRGTQDLIDPPHACAIQHELSLRSACPSLGRPPLRGGSDQCEQRPVPEAERGAALAKVGAVRIDGRARRGCGARCGGRAVETLDGMLVT